MKKLLFLSVIMAQLGITALAQTNFILTENNPVMVYALPKTELCIQLEIEKTTQKPGEFFRYSERYLATKDVVTEEKTTYRLKNINVKTNAVPDPARTYAVAFDKKNTAKNIAVNDKGLLCGINITCNEPAAVCTPAMTTATAGNSNPSGVLPLTEEYMLASSVGKMAEGAAKQIYRIRESRINLLTGDVDLYPADGESFKTMLAGMDQLEKELTELFTGSITTETQTHTLYMTPEKSMKNEVLFRISALKGLVAASDLSGAPYYINVLPETIATQPADPKKSKAEETFYTVLPALTQVSLGDGKSTFFSGQILMPQFGQLIPVSENLLQNKLYIDANTGRLLKVE